MKLNPFEDSENEGNSPKYHTGKVCIEKGCNNPAGTSWSEYWCFQCNVKRMRRINKNFADLMQGFEEMKKK